MRPVCQPEPRFSPSAAERRARLTSVRATTPAQVAVPVPVESRAQAAAGGLDAEVFPRLLADRVVFLGREVDDALANQICAQLLLLAAQDDRRDISLYVNSPGGSTDAGMAIYDTMQFIGNDVATYALGLAASMAQLIVCAGAPGKRYALPHARIMMHQPHGGLGGTASDIAIQAEQAVYIKRIMNERNAFHSGKPVEEIARDSERDRWFTAEEAREYGLIDTVVSRVTSSVGSGAGNGSAGPKAAAGERIG
jgi:ATP-dependent Clp protease, protease subunit